jgi:hypothetical protein
MREDSPWMLKKISLTVSRVGKFALLRRREFYYGTARGRQFQRQERPVTIVENGLPAALSNRQATKRAGSAKKASFTQAG